MASGLVIFLERSRDCRRFFEKVVFRATFSAKTTTIENLPAARVTPMSRGGVFEPAMGKEFGIVAGFAVNGQLAQDLS